MRCVSFSLSLTSQEIECNHLAFNDSVFAINLRQTQSGCVLVPQGNELSLRVVFINLTFQIQSS